ncbi:OadG family protein [Chloroflexus aggregans]|uniref:Sodium pump decarboxylase, gamma subunit n=1 Tax=Chloroflexus aggregans (strain MD-66 / DSM 9485) TaxID=326427 RepID=B8G6H9_CHLAD|nr:OadG family protein [Chloroflexus aggregans]ACL23916.1 sodium pump decarboxylase, gamma subunit [Chloroflexus aggregans DSM 9485]
MIDPTADPLIVGVQIALTGMSIVFVVLTIIAFALSALRASQHLFRRRPKVSQPVVSSPPSTPTPADRLDPQLVAVLAAAAFATLGQPVRIVRVRYYRQMSGMWARLGRVSVMAARQLRR